MFGVFGEVQTAAEGLGLEGHEGPGNMDAAEKSFPCVLISQLQKQTVTFGTTRDWKNSIRESSSILETQNLHL